MRNWQPLKRAFELLKTENTKTGENPDLRRNVQEGPLTGTGSGPFETTCIMDANPRTYCHGERGMWRLGIKGREQGGLPPGAWLGTSTWRL